MADLRGPLNEHDSSALRKPFRRLFVVILIAFCVLAGRLWYLQIIKGEEFLERSENNSVRLRKIKPLRGLILDAQRRVVVDNQASFDLIYIPTRSGTAEPIVEKIRALYAGRGLSLALQPLPSGRLKPFVPIRLEKNISMEKVALVETAGLELPGISVEVVPIRKYLEGEILSQVIGYTGEVSQDDIDNDETGELGSGDIVGKYGIEKHLDAHIGGKSGAEQVEVNVVGKVVKALGRVVPEPGYNVVLTLDTRIQRAAWEAMDGRPGAVVMVDVRDGSVLALVSSPSFDPNLFNSGISAKEWEKLSRHPLRPLENRAVAGQYPPASTYKPFVAVAALEEELIKPETRFFCNGGFDLGTRTFRCWQKLGHGWENLHTALLHSCDVYFYNVGKILGVDALAKYAKAFGFGSRTGIDLPREKPGLVPSKEWKLTRFKEPWQLGETISVSIGQGYNLTTPLQLALGYAALANGGTRWQPRVVSRIEAMDGRVIQVFPPVKTATVDVSPETLARINAGLWGVVNEGGGTGAGARRPEGDVAGKTGTAQVVGLPDDARRARYLSGRFKDHALFAAFAPYKSPEVAVAVIVEHGGGGGAVAAPVARRVLDAYFEAKRFAKAPPAGAAPREKAEKTAAASTP